MEKQHKHLQSFGHICQSSLSFHDKAFLELKKKVTTSRALYVSHIEGIQNAVRLLKSTSNAGLDEISSIATENCSSLHHLLAVGEGEVDVILKELESTLSTHRGEVANFTKEIRKKFDSSLGHAKEMSTFITGFFVKLSEESKTFQNHSNLVHENQAASIADLRKAYEEQSRSEAEKLIADVTNLVSSHMHRQKELVNGRLSKLAEAATENKVFLDGHVSSVESVASDAKRKWEEFSMQAQHDLKDGSDYSAAKHCRMELLLQQCVDTVDAASQQLKNTGVSLNEMSSKHVLDMDALIRNAAERNEQHDTEVASARSIAEEDATRSTIDINEDFESVLAENWELVKKASTAVERHSSTIEQLKENHSDLATNITHHSETIFQSTYMDYEPSGNTPVRSEPDIPSKYSIEALRALPTDSLLEEFRENNPYEATKDKPSLIPRSPLIQLN